MADGLATVASANRMLDGLRNVSWTSTGTFIELHTASPGSAGTTAVSVGAAALL